MTKPLNIEIEWKFLERIAEYYQFPSAVFLGDSHMFKYKTRDDALKKKAEFFDKVKELFEEHDQ